MSVHFTVGLSVANRTRGHQGPWPTRSVANRTRGHQGPWPTTPVGNRTRGHQGPWPTTPVATRAHGQQGPILRALHRERACECSAPQAQEA
jgi:hypothetical protein